MNNGVRFSTAQSIHIDEDVKIGAGSYIGGDAQLFGNTEIGEHTSVCAFTVLHNAKIGSNTIIRPHAIINESTIGSNCTINSFSFIHQQSTVHDNCTVESFTELNNQKIKSTAPKEARDKKKDKTFVAAFKAAVDQSFSEGV
jgi:bifunctional N-acetylglucosamine-1-phosphate-uridyltransferase/glucosamine-1-phosphate-acetyltransferase GlmU-like protein